MMGEQIAEKNSRKQNGEDPTQFTSYFNKYESQ